jgi:hypothetical protein
MEIMEVAAIAAASVLGVLVLFQLALAAGMPLARAAWGGEHRVLPSRLRLGSAVAVPILGAAAWLVLARADLVTPGADSMFVRIAVWVFTGYFTLNTLGNLASKSKLERAVMTPATVLLVACFVTVALS